MLQYKQDMIRYERDDPHVDPIGFNYIRISLLGYSYSDTFLIYNQPFLLSNAWGVWA